MNNDLIERLEKLMNEESNCRDIIADREESIPRRNDKIKRLIELYFTTVNTNNFDDINKIKIHIKNAIYHRNENLKIIEKNKRKLQDINYEISEVYDLLKDDIAIFEKYGC